MLLTALEQIQLGHGEYAARASSLLTQMRSFEIYFALKLTIVYQFTVDLTVQEALNGSGLLRTHLQTLRNDGHFDRFYESL